MCVKFDFIRNSALGVLTFAVFLALSGQNSTACAADIRLDGPIDGVPQKAFSNLIKIDLAPLGYEGMEFTYSGTANSYQPAGPLTPDGKWSVKPDGSEKYGSRLVVFRPKDARKFNGNVIVEWMNVTNGHFDSPVDWRFMHNEFMREGAVWIGVSAQAIGVNGAKDADAERYRVLVHPGDSFSYDIFTQAGLIIRQDAARILPGMRIREVIADGESQSAGRFVTYINAVHPLHKVYDGFFLHSRGRSGAALAQSPQTPVTMPPTASIRDDTDVPVFVYQSEFDVNGGARQKNTDRFRIWEVAGTTHVGEYGTIGLIDDGASPKVVDDFADALLKPVIEIATDGSRCEAPKNGGADYFVMNAAMHHLQAWISDKKKLPPISPLIEVDSLDPVKIRLDELGNGMGGIRTPQVDVPVAKLGAAGVGPGNFCRLGGTTTPFTAEQLKKLYRNSADFITKWQAATDDAVRRGFVLASDRQRLTDIGKKLSEAMQ